MLNINSSFKLLACNLSLTHCNAVAFFSLLPKMFSKFMVQIGFVYFHLATVCLKSVNVDDEVWFLMRVFHSCRCSVGHWDTDQFSPFNFQSLTCLPQLNEIKIRWDFRPPVSLSISLITVCLYTHGSFVLSSHKDSSLKWIFIAP